MSDSRIVMRSVHPELARTALRYLVLSVISLLFLAPFLLAVMSSLKSPAQLVNVLSLPRGFYWQNFALAWLRIGNGVFNSLKITLPATALSVLVGALAAYPLAQVRFRGDHIVYFFLLAGMFVPYQIVLIPMFLLVRALHLYNTIPGLWLVHTGYGVPICTFFMRNYFSTIPKSLFDAGQLDGCGVATYFARILLPVSTPGLAALAIIQARAIWNDLIFALTLTNSARTEPLTVQLYSFLSSFTVEYGPLMAATLMSVVPVTAIFLAFQRTFVRGILGSAVKG